MTKPKLKIPKSVHSMSDNSLISVLMMTVTLAISISFVLSRLWISDVKFNNKVITAKNQVNSTLKHNVDQLAQLKSNFSLMQQNGVAPSDVLAALPTTVANGDFANDLEAIAALSGVQLQSVAPAINTSAGASSSAPATPQQAQFEIVVTGSYQNDQKFLQNLQASRRPVIINSVNISGAEPLVSLDLTVATFYQLVTDISPQTKELKQ